MSDNLKDLNVRELVIIRDALTEKEKQAEEYIVSVSRVGDMESILHGGERLKELKELSAKIIEAIKIKRTERK